VDIADRWRGMRAGPTDPPQAGAHRETDGEGITITVRQQCQTALPLPILGPEEVTVTVTSHRQGVGAQVTIGANLNSPDGSYQGPTTTVGQGQFTGGRSRVRVGFIVLPSGWPVLGVGAQAAWEDGAPESFALTYVQLECTWVWWLRWLIPVLDTMTRPVRTGIGLIRPRSAEG
jgi:hypothetical protein